jgi:glycosyltransferase involved in cell wall biosynthesis
VKVLFLTDGSIKHSSTRYRVHKYLDYLEKEGVECLVLRFRPKNIGEILKMKQTLKDHDVIFLQKVLLSFMQARALRRFNPRIIYDLDDALFLKPDYIKYIKWLDISYLPSRNWKERMGSLTFFSSLGRKFRPLMMLRLSRHVIVGNSFLQGYAKKYNNEVTVIPTSIDLERYIEKLKPKPVPSRDKLIIGWIGTSGNLVHLRTLKGVFRSLGKRYKNLFLKIVCDEFPSDLGNGRGKRKKSPEHLLEGISIIKKKWSLEEEIEDLSSFDIGIMPLIESDYAKGKCGFKILQYMGMKIPVVASPVGINGEIIIDGVNGFTASEEEEWIDKLSRLIENPDLRQRLGKEGFGTVEKNYTVEVNAPKLKSVIEKVYQK